MGDVAHNLAVILSKIKSRASGNPVRLVAVSKTKEIPKLMEAHAAGQRHFGENYVLELQEKSLKMPDDVKWHFIGHLQTNKVKKLLETRHLWVVETVDSLKLAKELNKHLEANKTTQFNPTIQLPLNVFVQVKTSDEESKSGVDPGEPCTALVKAIMEDMPNLKVCGLMTIGKLHGDPSDDFSLLKSTRTQLTSTLNLPEESFELSMGMSSDFEIAIDHGSTSVRVGSSIFGSRAPKHSFTNTTASNTQEASSSTAQ